VEFFFDFFRKFLVVLPLSIFIFFVLFLFKKKQHKKQKVQKSLEKHKK
jgi:preprotein translocase subunit YajC